MVRSSSRLVLCPLGAEWNLLRQMWSGKKQLTQPRGFAKSWDANSKSTRLAAILLLKLEFKWKSHSPLLPATSSDIIMLVFLPRSCSYSRNSKSNHSHHHSICTCTAFFSMRFQRHVSLTSSWLHMFTVIIGCPAQITRRLSKTVLSRTKCWLGASPKPAEYAQGSCERSC